MNLLADVLREKQRDFHTEAERQRLLNCCAPQPTFTRRAATPLGRALIYVGAQLLRYGRAENLASTAPYRAPSRRSG
jgi:hypothetical protein